MRAKILTLVVLAAAAVALPATSFAGGPRVGVSIAIGGPPVAFFPPPPVVYYPPPPVVYYPQPFYAPPTVVFRGGAWGHGHWGHGHQGRWGHGHNGQWNQGHRGHGGHGHGGGRRWH